MKRTEITIREKGRNIVGSFLEPETSGSEYAALPPLVICSHGYGSTGTELEILGTKLADRGVPAFCFDFCGGSRAGGRSSGDTRDMSVLTERNDLLAVLRYWKASGLVDPERISLFGVSQGGVVSALAAEAAADEVSQLFLMCPAFCISDDWNRKYSRKEEIPDEYEFWGMQLGRCYVEAIHGKDLVEMVGAYPGPVQILHGDQDEIVALSYSERVVKRYADASLIVFPGEHHGFTEDGFRKTADRIADCVKS